MILTMNSVIQQVIVLDDKGKYYVNDCNLRNANKKIL